MEPARHGLIRAGMFAAMLLVTFVARSETVVLTNRSGNPVSFQVWTRAENKRTVKLPAGDVVPIPVLSAAQVELSDGETLQNYRVEPNRVYAFDAAEQGVVLQEILFPGQREFADVVVRRVGDPPRSSEYIAALGKTGVIPVKLFVDEDEHAERSVWEARLRKRIETASDIIERHCRIRFEVVEVDTWQSDDNINDFFQSLREFIIETRPGPARLAIGFSSQYGNQIGPTKLGGIPGPFFSHLLIREWPQRVSEAERLEVLIHELGHYLGASHSPEQVSCMRPVVGDRQANSRNFRLGYDPVNTLILNLVSEEMRTRGISDMRQLRFSTKAQLAGLYTTLAAVVHNDNASLVYLKAMGIPTDRVEKVLTRFKPAWSP
jgi:hypothetical protein